ncbi:hypothetical protein LIER_34112 [Lithospermum erythrorhizon]|uniref:non-specific serine/threonine protein kinase n=1 Tax=Lithospermum erythrorhizon TaxID=34254 RepID=A0AAV3S0U6_LITER
MSSVLSPVLGSSSAANSSTTADPPSPDNPTNTTRSPPPPSDSSAPPPKSDSDVPAAPPQSDSEPPPPPPPSSPPPPSLPTSPPPSDLPPPPPSPPNAPPPVENPPPPSKSSPPKHSPPPKEQEAPPPSPPAVPSSSPPPAPPPPVDDTPPPSDATPPIQSPPPPAFPPPPDAVQAPPPSSITPHNTTAPPPNLPSSSSPPLPPPAAGRNTSIPASPPVPSIPKEKPIAKPTIPSPNNSTASPRDAGGVQGGSIVAIVLVGLLTLSLVAFAVCFVQRRKKKKAKFTLGYMMPSPFSSSQNSDSLFLRTQQSALGSANHSPYHSAQLSGSASTNNFAYSGDAGGLGSSRSWFTYEELAEATNGFSKNNLLGEGGFGWVYKGTLADGRVVAIKQLKIGGGQGEREFKAEIEIISRIHHRHLVSIVGYCITDSQRMLVLDYVPNDTLYHHLHGKESVMTWATRFKCATGSARGLAYLHEDCNPRIIHRDIKSANILLDNNFEAKVADFGLARLSLELEAHTHVSTRVMGTFGYMAPEYATTGKLTEKSDVFSFGVVLLELITGRKPVDSTLPLGDEGLVEWARPLLAQALENENFDDVVDHRLENNFVKSEMFRLIEAAAACVRHSASKRPKMSQVVRALESVEELSDLTNGLKPGESQIFDSRQQSAQIKMFQKMAFGSQEYSSDFFNNSQSSWRTGL